ncbi:unnamed protein product [Taenia asiatica]|uniref:Seipin n=1 Tax=Taenia asiatica TaxID=60517 RepID=A0A0R3VUX2_TAEAS|nr:unnamed protein product [Taenia asiatica]
MEGNEGSRANVKALVKISEETTMNASATTPLMQRWRMAARVAYIGGAILLTCALLLEGIFVRLLLVPYLREADFKPTHCILHNTFYDVRAGLQRCESRCVKLAASFPCLVVRVRFLQPHDRSWHTGYLFDQLLSFQRRQPHFVSACL